jgi:hypothetical protein
MKKVLAKEIADELLGILQERFEVNINRHSGIEWAKVYKKLVDNPDKLWSLNEMEMSGGEPDLIAYDSDKDEYIYCDCSIESPKGRRSLCYDDEALDARKEHKPKDSALNMANSMGAEMLSEEIYRKLQACGEYDTKTSSWLKTPNSIRKKGGAIFGDYRYGSVFIYHNGAESYYASRGFRAMIRL